MGVFTYPPPHIYSRILRTCLTTKIYWVITERERRHSSSKTFPLLKAPPDSAGSFSKNSLDSSSFCLKYKNFQGIQQNSKAILFRLQGGGGKLWCPSFPSPSPFSRILTYTGWKSRLITQEPGLDSSSGFQVAASPRRLPNTEGWKLKGWRTGWVGGAQWRNYLSKVPSSVEFLASSSVIKLTVFPLKAWLWKGRECLFNLGLRLERRFWMS